MCVCVCVSVCLCSVCVCVFSVCVQCVCYEWVGLRCLSCISSNGYKDMAFEIVKCISQTEGACWSASM